VSTYVLAKGRRDALLFVCGETPDFATAGHDLERARHFDSPEQALTFRASMNRKDEFIVHEYDGRLLHSLDV
jgi:hypothetical protein